MLDSGTAGNQEYFWTRVREDFIDPTITEYSFLKFTNGNDGIFEPYKQTIDPGIAVAHKWQKLRQIWKEVNKDY